MRLFAALLGALVAVFPYAATAQPSLPAVVYEAPAQNLPAGRLGTDPFSAVLPSGRLVKPEGRSVVVGMNALGVALSPDGRYAIVSNDDERLSAAHSLLDPAIAGGYSLAVVDVETMHVTSQYLAQDAKYFAGIVATADPLDPSRTLVVASGGGNDELAFFTLDANGRLTPDRTRARLPIGGPILPLFANSGRSFPGSLVLSRDGATAYVVANLGGTVSAIDLRRRSVRGTEAVGFFPLGAAVAGNELLVSNEGLMHYGVIPTPTLVPPMRTAPRDPEHASGLSFVPLDATGDVNAAAPGAFPRGTLQMDRSPDGMRIVGGAHPSAIVVTPDNSYAFVAMTSVDRIAVVALTGAPRVVAGLELRLFPRGAYGTQPDALALSHDAKRLYVALAGLDAVAVVNAENPLRLRRLGLIPTGWYPTALALSTDDRTLYVTNAKGFGTDPGFVGDAPFAMSASGRILKVGIDSNAVWSTFQRIDLTGLDLVRSTFVTLGSVRVAKASPPSPIVPPLGGGPSHTIKHVVVILEENKTFDSMLGDLTDLAGRQHGNGDPSLVSFDASVTPNLHALARTFALADNFYADGQESDAGHQFTLAGIASDYTQKTALVRGGRRPITDKNQDPEDYPRFGYIFNSLALHKISFRDYGDLIRVSGYDEGDNPDPKVDDPNFVNVEDRSAPTSTLGGLYSLDVPAPAVLRGHIDLRYPGWNLHIRDERRAREFIRDFDALAAQQRTPRYTFIWLPDDHCGFGKDIPPLSEEVADGDRALGIIVSHISRMPMWRDTAIFVMPDDSQSSRDHVSVERAYALVISPYAKAGYVGHRHLSTTSVLKTEEELLGLPPLSLGELLATDMRDFFTNRPRFAPYTAKVVPTQTASHEGKRIARLLEQLDGSGPDADAVRSGVLVDLSRQADRLAASRATYSPAGYAARQNALFDHALAVARTPRGE